MARPSNKHLTAIGGALLIASCTQSAPAPMPTAIAPEASATVSTSVSTPKVLSINERFQLEQSVAYQCPAPPSRPNGAPRGVCTPPPQWLLELGHASATLVHGTHGAPWAEYCVRIDNALREGLKSDVVSLSFNERVVGQSLALRVIASRGCSSMKRPSNAVPHNEVVWSYHPPGWQHPHGHGTLTASRRHAALLVGHLALTSAELKAKGSEPMHEVDRWIGPRSRWSERKSRVMPLTHEAMERYTRKFRPVRSDTRRAIFSQLIAIDRSWTPHITPLVGRIEFRNGFSEDASACAVKLDMARLRCASGHLKPMQSKGLQPNFFMGFVAPGRVSCNHCHGKHSGRSDDSLGDLDALPSDRTGTAHLAQRHRHFMAKAQELAERAQKLATEDSLNAAL